MGEWFLEEFADDVYVCFHGFVFCVWFVYWLFPMILSRLMRRMIVVIVVSVM